MEDAVDLLISAMVNRANQFNWPFSRRDESPDWFHVGHHQILMVTFPLAVDAADCMLDAAIQRAYDRWIVAGDRAANIVMFCLAPPEAETIPEWLPFSAKVERDEAICRKLVWFPGTISVEAFLDRTMLARPWEKAVEQGSEQLNALAASLAVPAGWMGLLSQEGLEGTDLIEALLSVEEGSGF